MFDFNIFKKGDTEGDLNLLSLLGKIPTPADLVLRGVNTLIATEPWAVAQIQGYAGKVLCVKVANWQWRLLLGADGLLSFDAQEQPANCTITVPLQSLFELPLRSPEEVAKLLHIEGEAGLAQMLSNVASQLKPDLESDLGRRFGPVIGGGLYRLIMATRRVCQSLSEKGVHYLVQESGMWARREEHSRLGESIQEVNAKLDRLSTGVNRT